MRTLVTGATGLVGNAVARLLRERGHAVRALVRDPDRAKRLLPPEVELSRGDVTDPASLPAAFAGVDWVFHAAGMPEQWQRDERIFDRVNAGGTRHVLAAAQAAGVRRVVYTSTLDVFAAPRGGTVREGPIDPLPKPSAYERSKVLAQREVELALGRGLDVVSVNPASVYGPGPVHVALNSYFIRLVRGRVPLLPPGGCSVVYIDGCAAAHLAAAERGVRGESYLLADSHLSMVELAAAIGRAAGLEKLPPRSPVWLVRLLAGVSAPLARLFGFEPLVAPGQLAFLLWDAHVDSGKAQRELGFAPMPLETGVERTLAALKADGSLG